MKKLLLAAFVLSLAPIFLSAEDYTYDKVEGYHAEWTLDEDQQIELQEMIDGQLHADGIYVDHPAKDARYIFNFKVETDFGKKAIEKKVATFYDVTVVYNIKLRSGIITIKSDVANYKSHDVQLSKILIDLWKPLCFEMLDQTCVMPVKDRVKVRNAASTLEFHYPPK